MGFFNKLFKRNVEGIVAPNQYYNPTTDDYELIQGSNGAAQVSLAGSNVGDYGVAPMDTDLTNCIGILVTGNGGAISVVTPKGTNITIPISCLPVGQIVALPVKRFNTAGTTATGVWAVYGK